ncbi:MAG: XTP/dITP diphosphatase [bacterium]
MRTIVLATRNRGKARELQALLAGLPARVRLLDEYPNVPSLPESGETFEANAIAKAAAVVRLTGCAALADDSGIEIDALGGAPGVHSATFLGDAATDADRNAWVLERLSGIPQEARTARYRAVVAVATPDGTVRTFEGICAGAIAEQPRGREGFGYDPIFVVAGYGQTMAELRPEVKNRISHRARALEGARPYLESLASDSAVESPPRP